MLAQTEAAKPSATSSPSDTVTLEPSPSNTSAPTESETPTPTQTNTPVPVINKATPSITSEGRAAKTAPLRFENKTSKVILVNFPSHNYDQYVFSDTWILYVPWGEYEYQLWIGEDGPYTGSFKINNYDKHTLRITDGKVKFLYP